MIRHRIVRGRIFADPKNGGDDLFLPREALLPLLFGAIFRIERHRRRVTDRVDLEEDILIQAILLFAHLEFGGRSLGGSRRGKKRRDGGKDDSNGVSKCSWFHRKKFQQTGWKKAHN